MKKTFGRDEGRPSPAPAPVGVLLGRYLEGDVALPLDGGQAVWPSANFDRHLVILGKTGTGKSYTAWTVFDGIARLFPDAQIFVIDANADPKMAEKFGASMVATGRDPLIFPQQRFNAWPKGDWRPIYNRLLKVIPFAESDGAAYYTDAATVILQLACRLDGVPPSSTAELFRRLDYSLLKKAYGPDEVKGIKRAYVEALHMRCKSVWAHLGSALDGTPSFADLSAGYFGLDAMVLGKSAVVTMRMLLSQFEHYIAYEKDRDRLCVVLIDEFASLAKGVSVATFVEFARKLGVCVILMSQTVPGIGDRAEVARVLHNPGLLIVHATPEWEDIAPLIGTAKQAELTLRNEGGAGTELDRVRFPEKSKVSGDELLSLPIGHVWVFRNNQATKLAITLPDTSDYKPFCLPTQEEVFEPVESASPGDAGESEPFADLLQSIDARASGAEGDSPPADSGESAPGDARS